MCLLGIIQLNAQIGKDSLSNARLILAKSYINGTGSKRQPEKVIELLTESANAGNGEAMNAIGVIFRTGTGGIKDSLKSIEWFRKAANAGYINAWYNLGNAYKETMDFANAYQSYCKAADMGDAHSIFLKGYMLYKGLGCTQDYKQAAALFAQGAELDKPRSMYFYGLCYRNGYGIAMNLDSARYWLGRSAEKGNGFAMDELMKKLPENVEIAGTLSSKIKAAQAAMPNKNKVNQYRKVEHKITRNDVAGAYQGYLLKYDWSGQHVIEANKLELILSSVKDSLKGLWKEDDSIALPIQAQFTPDAIIFNQLHYGKTSHYSQTKIESTVFQKAYLQLTSSNREVYLSGNIQGFVPKDNEPQKPLFLALVRVSGKSSKGKIPIVSQNNTPITTAPLRAYPNPFNGIITMDFELKVPCNVTAQLYTVNGKLVYSNPAGRLSAGSYTLPMKTQQVAAGYYMLVLRCGDDIRRAKVMKF